MKRSIAILLSFLIFAGIFSACSSGSKEIDISTLSQELLDSDAFPDGLEAVDLKAGCYLYGLDSGEGGPIAEAQFYLSSGAVADEFALIKTDSKDSAANVKAAIEARLEYLKTSFESYNPGEVSQLENAALKISGVYVVFVCADNQSTADKILDKYL